MRAFIIQHEVDFAPLVRDEGTGEFVKQGSNKKSFCNGFVIASHYNHSIDAYMELVGWAVDRLPQINRSEIELRTVARSGWCKGCPMIRFPLPVGTKHPDFGSYMNDVYEA